MSKMIYKTNANGILVHQYEDPGRPFLEFRETYKAPPVTTENQVAVLDPQQDRWSIIPDFRGTNYYLDDGSKVTITVVGETVPDDAILVAPAGKYYDSYDRDNNEWLFNYNQCRKDLTDLVEYQEGFNQLNGISIDGVMWDTDMGAHLKYTQIVTSINRIDIKNIKNGTSIPYEPIQDFQINDTTYIDLTEVEIDVFWKAIEHHLRELFKWSKASRDTITDDAQSPAGLLALFDSLVFTPFTYDAAGAPIVG